MLRPGRICTSWAIQSPPSPGDDIWLLGVDCVSATWCTAVGSAVIEGGSVLVAEHWNGTAWATEPTAKPATRKGLAAVSCTAAHTCTAVGASPELGEFDGQTPLAEQQ